MIAQLDKVTPERDGVVASKRTGQFFKKHAIFVAEVVLVFIAALSIYCWFALTHLPPAVFLGEVDVSLTTRVEALERFREQTPALPDSITFTIDDAAATLSASRTAVQLKLRQEPALAVDEFMGKNTSLTRRIGSFTRRLFLRNKIDLPILFDDSVVNNILDELAHGYDRASRAPSISLTTSGVAASLELEAGETGVELDRTASAQLIVQQLEQRQAEVRLPRRITGRVLSEQEEVALQERAGIFVGKRLTATAERLQFSLNDQEIIELIDPPNSWSSTKLETLIDHWQQQAGTLPQEPEFEYDQDTLSVTSFSPPRNGRTIQTIQTKELLLAGFEQLLQDPKTKVGAIELVLVETPPTTSLGSLNYLGIQERIGFGESYYAHSIPNRIHNVALTAARINNTLIPPGSEFSFNKALGDVSAASGFKAAYIIKNGKTELGDGGGVCQVSTTVFRAILNAGLEVTKRLPHSYRVSYYELDRKPGIDATVYAGDIDLRFKNDTPNHILLYTVTDDKNTYMYVELYGTADGRHTEIVEHKTWDARPAPPPQYFPDPTLPLGKLVQIDWPASGIRASFTNVIYDKNDQVLRRDTYTSNYKPWSAKFLQGVAP